jgi:NAD(P)-dependent dehydrogenase (short-subunit alcohol dehydrogenase family)
MTGSPSIFRVKQSRRRVERKIPDRQEEMSLIDELFSLQGKVALVTGASSGIGQCMAETLAEAGAAVVLVARRRTGLEAAAKQIADRGAKVAFLLCDLADRAKLSACAAAAANCFGAPDILVNAAGVNIRKQMEEVSEDDWDHTMAINLAAPFLLAQKLAPAMLGKGWGRIINIASLQSVRAFSNSGPYGASKAGVMQLTRAQSEAWSARGITVNAIAPGFFNTPLTAPVFADPKRAQAMAARTMIGRNGEMRDLRGATIFLASLASDYITGQTLFVDGGFSAG